MQINARLGLLHHVGGGNLGDDATLEAVAASIRERCPQAEIIAFSMNPDDTERRHAIRSHPIQRIGWSIGYQRAQADGRFKTGVKALARKSRRLFNFLKTTNAAIRLPADTLRELQFLASSRHLVKSLDRLIISGGGQLTDKGGPWSFPYTIFKWVALARTARVSCIFLNVGAGPLTRPASRLFVRRALRAADYVSLRDEKSQALVREIGFTGASRVRPDSAYALEIEAVESTRETGSRSIVGLAPMRYPDPEPGGYLSERNQIVYDAFIGKLARFAAWLVSRSHTLSLFGTDFGVDPQAIERLQSILSQRHRVLLQAPNLHQSVNTVRGLLTAMSGMDYVVTSRFHGVVFAHLLNKPVLAIAPHPKVVELMNDLDLSSYCVDIKDFDSTLLADRFSSMVANAADIRTRMAASLTRRRLQLGEQFDELFRSVARSPSLERTVLQDQMRHP